MSKSEEIIKLQKEIIEVENILTQKVTEYRLIEEVIKRHKTMGTISFCLLFLSGIFPEDWLKIAWFISMCIGVYQFGQKAEELKPDLEEAKLAVGFVQLKIDKLVAAEYNLRNS